MTEQINNPHPAPDGDEPARAGTGHDSLVKGIAWVIGALVFGWLMNNETGTVPTQREMMQAESLIWQQRYDEAIQAFSVIIERNPQWYWPYGHRGEAYRMKGDLDRALTDLNEAIRLKPDFEEALFSRCQVWRRKGDAGRAMPDCTEAARLKPDEWTRHQVIAELLLANGEFERAYEKLGEVIRLGRGATPYLYRGLIALFRFDRPAEAAEDFAKGAKEAFAHRGAVEMLGGQVVNGVWVTDLMGYQHPFIPDGIYLLIWTHMARARAGQDDSKELQEHADKLASPIHTKLMFEKIGKNVTEEAGRKSREPWPGPIFALFLDHTTPVAVRAAAESAPDAEMRRRRLCDANFYIAELYLEKKRQLDEARTLLQAAADECPASARERAFARAELKRLGW